MRTIVNTTIGFGAVVIPVGVASSGSRKNVELNKIHTCGTKMEERLTCPACGVTCHGSDDEGRRG